MAYRIITLILLLLGSISSTQATLFSNTPRQQFVPVNQAFAFDFSQKNNQLTLSWKVKPGYYLYRQQIHITPENASISPFTLPAGEPHEERHSERPEWQAGARSICSPAPPRR